MLKHMKGDLLELARDGKFHVIVQGCNCFQTMGSGIAKQVREQYPDAYRADCQYSFAGDYMKLGNYSVMLGKQFNIINAYTQFDFNRKGHEQRDRFEYHAFALILQKLLYAYPTCDFGFPYIGMGLAGGNEQRIIGLLEWFAGEVGKMGGSATLVEYA